MPTGRPTDAAQDNTNSSLSLEEFTSSAILPLQLSGVVPDCAQQCLTTYIDQEYTCSGNDFACLCQDYSSDGFTLGELAYICWHKHCNRRNLAEGSSLYTICGAQTNAASPTLSTLTPPATTLSTTLARTTTSSTAVAASTSPASSTPSRNTSSNQPTSTPRPSIKPSKSFATSSPPSNRPAAAATSSSPAVHHKLALSGGEVAGVVIAAILAIAFISVALALFVCYRRRRRKEANGLNEKSYDFVDRDPWTATPSEGVRSRTPLDPRPQPSQNPQYFDHNGVQQWQHSVVSLAQQHHNETGPANGKIVDPQRLADVNFGNGEYVARTPLAQGMPTRTNSNVPQGSSPERGLAQQVRAYHDFATANAQQKSMQPTPVFNGFGLPPNPKAKQSSSIPTSQATQPLAAVDRQYASLAATMPASQSTDAIQTASGAMNVGEPVINGQISSMTGSTVPTTISSPKFIMKPALRSPLPLQSPYGLSTLPVVQEVRTPMTAQSRDSSASLLNYYASPEAGNTIQSPIYVASPKVLDHMRQRKRNMPSAITVTKPNGAKRRDSEASDTSFESADPDEPTPPDEIDRQLTPVQESPVQTSPITDIRYPKIPRSANQSIPRSPPQSSPPRAPHQPLKAHIRLPKSSAGVYRAYTPNPDQYEEWPLKTPVTPDNPIKTTTTTSTLSGSTLAAKRRGSSAAQSLELRLDIRQSSCSPLSNCSTNSTGGSKHRNVPAQQSKLGSDPTVPQNSPLKGYGRVANSPSCRKPQHQLRSQQQKQHQSGHVNAATQHPCKHHRPPPVRTSYWEPKLTPQKRGDDLYLQVGIATPMQATFF